MINNFTKIIKIFYIAIFCLLLIVQGAVAQSVNFKESEDQNTINFYAGTLFKAVLQQKISTGVNNVGDRVEFITPADISLGETVCLPEGSRFIGKIVRLGKPTVGSNGYIQMIFDILRLPDGQDISIFASIWSKKGEGIFGGEPSLKTGYRPVVTDLQGIGSFIHMIPAGPREMGKDSELLPGSEVIIVLDKNLTFNIFKE